MAKRESIIGNQERDTVAVEVSPLTQHWDVFDPSWLRQAETEGSKLAKKLLSRKNGELSRNPKYQSKTKWGGCSTTIGERVWRIDTAWKVSNAVARRWMELAGYQYALHDASPSGLERLLPLKKPLDVWNRGIGGDYLAAMNNRLVSVEVKGSFTDSVPPFPPSRGMNGAQREVYRKVIRRGYSVILFQVAINKKGLVKAAVTPLDLKNLPSGRRTWSYQRNQILCRGDPQRILCERCHWARRMKDSPYCEVCDDLMARQSPSSSHLHSGKSRLREVKRAP